MEEGGKSIKLLTNFFVFFSITRIKTENPAFYLSFYVSKPTERSQICYFTIVR